jgi:CBS domain-containing protein
VFPVLGLDGRPVGLVGRSALLRLPEEARSATSLGEVARSAGDLPVVGPDDPAEAAVRALNPMRPLVPVVDGVQLVGVVTAADVAHAAELAPL